MSQSDTKRAYLYLVSQKSQPQKSPPAEAAEAEGGPLARGDVARRQSMLVKGILTLGLALLIVKHTYHCLILNKFLQLLNGNTRLFQNRIQRPFFELFVVGYYH